MPKLHTALFCLVLGLTPATGQVQAASQRSGAVNFTVTPAAAGLQVVRTSLPLPAGFLSTNQGCTVKAAKGPARPAAVRVLAWHSQASGGGGTARRALVTFPYKFDTTNAVAFTLERAQAQLEEAAAFPVTLVVKGESLMLQWNDARKMDLKFLAPARTSAEPPRVETVEENRFYRWQRLHFGDRDWPRIIEFRFDTLGTVVAVGHLQRASTNDCYAPEMGWELTAPAKWFGVPAEGVPRPSDGTHSFATGEGYSCELDSQLVVYHPTAPLKRRGTVETRLPSRAGTYRYLRCRAEDKVPMQMMSWQRAEVVIAPKGMARLTSSLSSPHRFQVEPSLWSALYGRQEPLPKLSAPLQRLVEYHRDAIVRSAAVGDDFGNVTGYNDGAPHGPAFGMNRLNHGAPIFLTGWHGGDARLIETGLLWCDNFFDQSIWWGEPAPGGTRYNNRARFASTPSSDYMWRSDTSVSFCTKGHDCFWLAWEETGDPRMLEAFRAQVAYAADTVHANTGECRNIGDVRDFIRLYRYTGEPACLDNALRLFRELRTKLSTGHLFDQGGKPLDPDPPFIDEDKAGLKVGYAKPYIIGYALVGLPELIPFAPNEPDLKETVRAVADFLAATEDPCGGWRYPHPASSHVIVSQGLEHAWQITQAARALGPEPRWLDAIELALRSRILGWQRTGKIFSSLGAWEVATGKVKDQMQLYDLYKKPTDRDRSRDWKEGQLGFGSSSPEGIVYFEDVLGYYLQHRPADRLLAPPQPEEPLGLILARAPKEIK